MDDVHRYMFREEPALTSSRHDTQYYTHLLYTHVHVHLVGAALLHQEVITTYLYLCMCYFKCRQSSLTGMYVVDFLLNQNEGAPHFSAVKYFINYSHSVRSSNKCFEQTYYNH